MKDILTATANFLSKRRGLPLMTSGYSCFFFALAAVEAMKGVDPESRIADFGSFFMWALAILGIGFMILFGVEHFRGGPGPGPTTLKEYDLEDKFTRAASGEQGEEKAGSTEGPQPKKRSKVDHRRRQKARKRD